MKKIYTLFFAITGAVAAFAQNSAAPANFPVENPKLIKPSAYTRPNTENKVQGTQSFWIDYDLGDYNVAGAMATAYPGAGYRQYLWPFNGNYDGSTTSPEYTQFGTYIYRYFIVGFDSLYDASSSTGYDPNMVASVTIDSLSFVIGQENNSGTDDTLKISIINLATKSFMSHYPGSVVYQAMTPLIIPGGQGLSLSNQFSDPVGISLPVNYALGNGIKTFGIKIEYTGSKQDTCALLVGFNDEGGDGSICYDKPFESAFAHTSSAPRNGCTYVWNDYIAKAFSVTEPLPTSNVANVYVECDGVGAGGAATIGDGKSMIQNAVVMAKVTIVTVGMEELKEKGVYVQQNMPNPFNGNAVIGYRLADNKNVKLEVLDITGKKVMSADQGFQSAGSHSITINSGDLKAGVYFYTLTAGDVRITKKMTVTE